eukprot:g6875.t1
MSKISNAIAEKLLEGYTLLEEHCPVTKNVPLLLDPSNGRKWYVKIDAARQLLVSTRDISQSRTAAALINECGIAIKALESVTV